MCTHFCGGIVTLWPCLVELHEKKSRTIPKILPWSLKFKSIYKLVVMNISNGFFLYSICSNTRHFALKKVTIFISNHWLLRSFTAELRQAETPTRVIRRHRLKSGQNSFENIKLDKLLPNQCNYLYSRSYYCRNGRRRRTNIFWAINFSKKS